MTNNERAIETAKAWLKSKHCTLWQNWDISTEDGLEAAAVWMIDTMNSLVDFHEANLEESLDW